MYTLLQNNVNGDMEKAYAYVSSTLREKVVEILNWKKFVGKVEQFYLLIEDFKRNYPENYIGDHERNDQKRVADKIFSGNMRITYTMLSILVDFF